jgi:catechol 2,3-dioxygenase-like lactoylglutathione lyase family enzyme
MARATTSFWIAAVTIACTDLARSVDFYEKLLGAVREPGDGYGCPWFKLGPVSISLLHNATAASPAKFPDHPMAMLWLETDDLAGAAQRFAKFGVEVLNPSDGQFMMVTDPDGIVIEVWQSEPDGSGVAAEPDVPPDPRRPSS